MIPELAVVAESEAHQQQSQQLANKLALPLIPAEQIHHPTSYRFFLVYREGCLRLFTADWSSKGGMFVNIEPRPGEQHSWPAPKKGHLALAIGRKTKTVIDATTGWAQDSLALFRMGYQLTCMERSRVMAALIEDGLLRLQQKSWFQQRELNSPRLVFGNAIELLTQLSFAPDCIYLDPMFPPKRKKSALAKKSMTVLRELLGDDIDKEELFVMALRVTGDRVVVKSPDDAAPLGGKPDFSYSSKLLRYDVYLRNNHV